MDKLFAKKDVPTCNNRGSQSQLEIKRKENRTF